MKTKFVCYTPFTGLGLYGGFRGNRWLKNRIKIFKEFVLSSLLNQTDREFIHWVSWRREERENPHVLALYEYMSTLPNYKVVFTFDGLCFWDDKFEDSVAREKLHRALKASLPALLDPLSDCDEVQWLLVPSDDLYARDTVRAVKQFFAAKNVGAITHKQGYICNYNTKEVREYNPKTNPPFFAIRFPRGIFFDPGKHMTYISMKEDVGKYKAGTPYPSHEYLPNCLPTSVLDERGFMVGTHGENISTHFNNPNGGAWITGVEREAVLDRFGIAGVEPLYLPISIRKWIMRRLPYRWQRKLRYIFGEMFVSKIYEFLRS